MNLDHQLKFCKLCVNQKYGSEGIVCGLTQQKPTFTDKCLEFIPSEKEINKIHERTTDPAWEGVQEEKSSPWGTIVSVVVIILIIIRFIMRMDR
jgi:hypothetical protein